MACALSLLTLAVGCKTAPSATTAAAPTDITAIDILLKPDATMVQHATAINDRLRKDYPKGFSLDASHRPHVTLAQRYVRTADLPKVYAAVGKVLAGADVTGLKLEAYKYYYIPVGELGLQGIVVKPTPELLKLQQAVIDAVTPFALKTGTAAAFVPPTDGSVIDPQVIEYVDSVCAGTFRRALPAACHHRSRLQGLPGQDGRRAVRIVHLLAGGRGGLSSWRMGHGREAAQGAELESLNR